VSQTTGLINAVQSIKLHSRLAQQQQINYAAMCKMREIITHILL